MTCTFVQQIVLIRELEEMLPSVFKMARLTTDERVFVAMDFIHKQSFVAFLVSTCVQGKVS